MANWPNDPDFPQVPLQSGFSQVKKDNTIRSPMGYGPAKIRPRTLVGIEHVTASIEIMENQVDILDTFYNNNQGLSWGWTNWITMMPANYRFLAPPTYRAMGGQWYSVTMTLEIVP